MRWKRQSVYGIGFVLILTTLTACASGSTGDFCGVYDPIYTNEMEREALRAETLRDIQGNNAVWLELCE